MHVTYPGRPAFSRSKQLTTPPAEVGRGVVPDGALAAAAGGVWFRRFNST